MDETILNNKLLEIRDKISYNKNLLLGYRDFEMNAFEMARCIDHYQIT